MWAFHCVTMKSNDEVAAASSSLEFSTQYIIMSQLKKLLVNVLSEVWALSDIFKFIKAKLAVKLNRKNEKSDDVKVWAFKLKYKIVNEVYVYSESEMWQDWLSYKWNEKKYKYIIIKLISTSEIIKLNEYVFIVCTHISEFADF